MKKNDHTQRSLLDLISKDNQLVKADHNYLGAKSRFVGYGAYIASSDWNKKREVAIKKKGHKCERCGTHEVPLEVHHKHYKTLYYERLEDVEVLCGPHHKLADKERMNRNEENAYDNAFATWATKKYGDEAWLHMDETLLMEEFEKWIEMKESEEHL